MQQIGTATPGQLSGELRTKVQPTTRLQLWSPLDPPRRSGVRRSGQDR